MTTKFFVTNNAEKLAQWLDSNVTTNTQFVCVTHNNNLYSAFVTDTIS